MLTFSSKKLWLRLALSLSALQPMVAFAWWDNVQSTISQVALQDLSVPTLEKVNDLLHYSVTAPGSAELSRATNDIVNASTWADRLKYVDWQYPDSKAYYKKLHFIDIPGHVDTTLSLDQARKMVANFVNSNQKQDDVVAGIKSMLKTLVSTQSSSRDKAIALRLLIDFTADVHQPMHCIDVFLFNKSTRGQNYIQLKPALAVETFDKKKSVQASELHAFWDAAGGYVQNDSIDFLMPNTPYMQYLKNVTEKMTLHLRERPDMIARQQDPDVRHWVADSYLLALDAMSSKKMTYAPLSNDSPFVIATVLSPKSYTVFVKQISEQQIYLAGQHLALLLNAVFDAQHSPINYLTYLHNIEQDPQVKTLAQLPAFS